jgi:crossover junction endodeoxyribonuclease RusA
MVYLSKSGRKFRTKMISTIGNTESPIIGRVKVRIELFAPTKRRYDIDNMVKAVHDALTHAGVWVDDEQVDELTVMRGHVTKGGSMNVEITEL